MNPPFDTGARRTGAGPALSQRTLLDATFVADSRTVEVFAAAELDCALDAVAALEELGGCPFPHLGHARAGAAVREG